MRRLTYLLITLLVLWCAAPVFAHANLLRSDPPANSSLDTAPEELRLWFTESLEPAYSRITLLDSDGAEVKLPPSRVDAEDATQMLLDTPDLAEGLYTVSWRVVSAADGHATAGSFAFGVGVAVGAAQSTLDIDESVPTDGVVIRWLNLLSLALLVGGLGFGRFVWQPAVVDGEIDAKPLLRMVWLGWLFVGLTTVLMLLLQLSVATGSDILVALGAADAVQFILSSNYGRLWLMRLALWLLLGGILWRHGSSSKGWLLMFVLAAAILLSQSLFSHASATADALAAVAVDWLHLLAATLWLGGLIALFTTLLSLRHSQDLPTSRLTAYFSNLARIAVVFLIISGGYATWLQVGSLEALGNTVFGQALLVKLGLFMPLLLIAAFNLLVTQRKLASGAEIWTRTLRALIATEVSLIVIIMIAVAVMTSGAPGRSIQAQRDAVAGLSADVAAGYFGMEIVNNQMVHLEIEPGTVGENTFRVSPYDVNGLPIDDASLIRLRFDNQDQDLGQSELRPEYDDATGTYVAQGSNISTPGNWRIRMSIQRPGEFDTVIDFETEIEAAPQTPPLVVNTAIPSLSRILAIGLTGVLLVGASEFFLLLRARRHLAVTLLAFTGMVVGGLCLSAAALSFGAGELRVDDAWARPTLFGNDAAVYLTLRNDSAQDEILVSAGSDVAATVEFHETQVENNLARMIQRETLPIAAGETLDISPGGIHVMLVDLHQDLVAGDSFPLTLEFESGESIVVDVAVDEDR